MRIGKRTRVIAHRGFSGVAPENTMIAFEKAIELGADMIELDVLLSRDGEVIVIHDDDRPLHFNPALLPELHPRRHIELKCKGQRLIRPTLIVFVKPVDIRKARRLHIFVLHQLLKRRRD